MKKLIDFIGDLKHQRPTRIGYRMRYYRRKLMNFIGLCHRCGSSVNYTRNKTPICPRCGK